MTWTPEHIRKLRESLGWSQEQLAEAVGYDSRSTVCLWESGQRQPHRLAQLALDRLAEEKLRRK
jgi:transcriptional regulator with XRE-family HTH domain